MRSGGYIALISAIIISVLLMLIVIGTSQIGFNSRFNILDSEFKEISIALAEACVDTVRLRLSVDETYPFLTPETITVGDYECQIICVEDDWSKTIAVKASPNNIHTNLVVELPSLSQIASPSSWEEVNDLSPVPCL